MREILKRWKADVLASALLCAAAGIIVMIWPEAVTVVLARVIGVVLVIMGITHGYSYLQDRGASRFGLASGVVIFALGILILVRPHVVAQMVSVVVGVLLLMHGMEDMEMGFESKRCGDSRWWVCMLLAAVSILLGIFVIWNYFQVMEVAAWLLGLALVYDGISDIIVVARVMQAAKRMREEAEALETEWRE